MCHPSNHLPAARKRRISSAGRHIAAAILVFQMAAIQPAGAGDEPSLYEEILGMDQLFFEAFNRCDIDTMGELFARDLEFFHDEAGVADYDQTMAAGIANCERNLGLVRTLDVDSMRVYPIKDYGAIQEAEHTFCHVENGEDDCGTFKFVHVWRKAGERWQLTRVISYGHGPSESDSAPEAD